MAILAGSSGGQLTKGTWSGGCGNHYGVGSCSDNPDVAAQPIPVGDNIHNLYVHLSAAPGQGNGHVFAIIHNGGGTGLSVRIEDAATSGSNTTDVFGVAPGDLVHVEAVESWGDPTPASVAWSVEIS